MKKFKDFVKGNKKYVAVAAAAVIGVGAIGAMPTLATMNPTAYKFASLLGIEKDLGEYTTAVNQMITSKEGVSVGIGEVAYDQQNHKLRIVTYITASEKVEQDKIWDTFTRVNINGEELNQGVAFEIKQVDEHTVAIIENHNIAEELDGKLNISIVMPQVRVNDNVYYNSDWKYEFTTDSSALVADTTVVELGQEVVVNEVGEKIELVKYVANDFEQSIYFKGTDRLERTSLKVVAQDNLGNEVVFEYAGGNTSEGGSFRAGENQIAADATSVTLQVYALQLPEQAGAIEGDYEKVGETFEVVLQK